MEIVAGEMAERLAALGVETVWVASIDPTTRPAHGRRPVHAWNSAGSGSASPTRCGGGPAALGLQVGSCDVVHLHDSLYLGNVAAYLWAAGTASRSL